MRDRTLLATCNNCGCKRYKPCGCQEPNSKSQTQQRKRNRLNKLQK